MNVPNLQLTYLIYKYLPDYECASKVLNRSRSTITREVKKWVQSNKDKYSDDLAHWNAKDDYLTKIQFKHCCNQFE